MDKVVDCAELYRISFYIWHGIDIGDYSDAVYGSKYGKLVTAKFNELPKCKPLDLCFYHTSSKKKTGHVAGIWGKKWIYHSGASENGSKVGFSKITWGKKTFMCAKRFLSDEEIAAVTVSGSSYAMPVTRKIKKGMKGRDVYDIEVALEAAGYDCKMTKTEMTKRIGTYGSGMKAALKLFQIDHPWTGTGGKPDYIVGKNTATQLGFDWVA
jgi:hypothetical protein